MPAFCPASNHYPLSSPPPPSQAAEEVAKHLQAMKVMLYGSGDQEPQTEMVAQLAQELYSSDMLLQLVDNLHRLDFEVRCTQRGC